jgi:hypothetical protein
LHDGSKSAVDADFTTVHTEGLLQILEAIPRHIGKHGSAGENDAFPFGKGSESIGGHTRDFVRDLQRQAKNNLCGAPQVDNFTNRGTDVWTSIGIGTGIDTVHVVYPASDKQDG